jgi:hypothetical protein
MWHLSRGQFEPEPSLAVSHQHRTLHGRGANPCQVSDLQSRPAEYLIVALGALTTGSLAVSLRYLKPTKLMYEPVCTAVVAGKC